MERPDGYTAAITKDRGLYGEADTKKYGWPHGTTKYRVQLKNTFTGKTFSFPFYTGPAVTGKPTFKVVVGAVISDATFYEDNPTLETFAAESGMSLDDREERAAAEKTFKACRNISEKLRALLGDDFDNMAEYTAQ